MSEEIKVSVILPVYNVEDYLRQCLDSVMNQTLKEIEVICVDDGSTDSSYDILLEYQEKYPNFKAIKQENGGAGAARNNGMRHAKGKYYSFLDSDDFFEPDMLEKAYDEAVEFKADMVVFNSDQFIESTGEYNVRGWTVRYEKIPPYMPFKHRQMTDNIFKVFVGWAWDKIFDADFVKKHNLTFQEQRTSNDLLFVFSAIALAERIAVVPRKSILAHQRTNNPKSLSNTREKSWDCFYHALNALKQRLLDEGLYKEMEKDFINYALHFSLWHLNTLAEPTHTKLYDKLRNEWFAEFGITGKGEAYFYNKTEYAQFERIMKHPHEKKKEQA